MSEAKIKFCPFCGKPPTIKQAGRTNYWWVGCEIHLGPESSGCGVSHSDYDRAEAIRKWNERADSVPTVSKTTAPSALASATGSVEWEPEAHKPQSYQSVLVYGVLECEQSPDTHEGYWTGQRWQSVRRDDDISALRKLKLLNVTHWACRPTPPNAESSHSPVK